MEKSRVLIVEDNANVYGHIKDVICEVEKSIEFEIQIDHLETLQELIDAKGNLGGTYDLMILDLRLDPKGEGSSKETLDQLNQISNKQFIPVVIYTGFASDVEEEYIKKWKFIKVIEKGSDANKSLEMSIKKLLITKFKFKSLERRIEEEFKVLSVDLLDEIFEGEDRIDEESVQTLMLSRLSALLTTSLNSVLKQSSIPVEAKIVYPPLAGDPNIPISMGDILEDPNGDNWFLASPTCDLIDSDTQKPKVKDVLLVRCLKSPEDRDHYLGEQRINLSESRELSLILRVPRSISETKLLFISPKLYKTKPYEEVKKWKKQLSITSPHADDAKAIFIRDLMRLGVPDTSPDHKELVELFKRTSGS